MVKHYVLFTLKEQPAEGVRIIRQALEPLEGKIDGVEQVKVTETFAGSAHCVLEVLLRDREALAFYADHPLHNAAKEQFFHLLSGRAAADIEV